MKTAQDSQGGTHEVWGCIDGAFNVWSEPVRKISLLKNKEISCIFFLYHPSSMGCISCGWEKLATCRTREQNAIPVLILRKDWIPPMSCIFHASCLLHYEHQRQYEETICPQQDGDLDNQANKTLTVWESLLLLNGWTAEKHTVCRCLW